MFAAEEASRAGVDVVLDIDFRPDQWHDPRAFGIAVRSVLRAIDIVIGAILSCFSQRRSPEATS